MSAVGMNPAAANAVRVDNDAGAGADFAKTLESLRVRSDALNEGANTIRNPQIQQLRELYNYSIDVQLIVRAANQVTTGVRQLMSGQ